MNSSGCSATSKSCSGLRRIFFSDRQAMNSVWLTVVGDAGRGRARATASAGSTTRGRAVSAGTGAIIVLT